VTSLVITATSPISTSPLDVSTQTGIKTTLFASGRGANNMPVTMTTLLSATGASSGTPGSTFVGSIPVPASTAVTSSRWAILDGSLYLTPSGSKDRGEAAQDYSKSYRGRWAIAYYSLACNDPTIYLPAHAPGDEGGVDSADGWVNVRLQPSVGKAFCMGFTTQIAPLRGNLAILSPLFVLQPSQPLSAGQATVLLHYFPFTGATFTSGPLKGLRPAVAYTPLTNPSGCTLVNSNFVQQAPFGTVAVQAPGDGIYQVVAVKPSALPAPSVASKPVLVPCPSANK
jgi:hypothetical protein